MQASKTLKRGQHLNCRNGAGTMIRYRTVPLDPGPFFACLFTKIAPTQAQRKLYA
jgi:hypothetical protein